MVNQGQIDQILTGIALGMPLEHMFILTELSPQDMEDLRANSLFMAQANASAKKLTYDLLKDLQQVIEVQKDKGKDHAITWLLEKTDSHFMPNNEGGDKPGVVNIFTKETTLTNSDTVSIQQYHADPETKPAETETKPTDPEDPTDA